MLNTIIIFIVYVAEMLIAYLFLSRVSERRLSQGYCLIIGYALFALGATANLLAANNLLINTITAILMHLLFSVICFQVKATTGIFYTVILCTTYTALDLVTVLIVAVFTQSQPENFNGDLVIFALDSTTSKTLYFTVVLLFSRLLKPVQHPVRLSFTVFLYPIATLLNFIALYYVSIHEQISPEGQYTISVIAVIMFIVMALLMFSHQNQMEKEHEFTQTQSELRRLQMEKAYYDILNQQNQQLMIYAHDVKNHLAAIQALNTDPHISGYVVKLSERLDSYTRSCHSGNILLDLIINKYVMECERCGISFDYNVKLYNMNNIEDMDLVSILGNLMDNALEAAQKSCAKEIYLETTRRNAYYVLLIRNSSQPPKSDNGQLVTSKADCSLHGFGLKSVAKTLKKYHGDLQWDYDDASNTFTMTVMIGNPVSKNAIHT